MQFYIKCFKLSSEIKSSFNAMLIMLEDKDRTWLLHGKWRIPSNMFYYIGWIGLAGKVGCFWKERHLTYLFCSFSFDKVWNYIFFLLFSLWGLEFAVFCLKVTGSLSLDGCICTFAHVFYHHRTGLMHYVMFLISSATTISEQVLFRYTGEEKKQFQVEEDYVLLKF